ncbi:MAG: hypothetical protein HY054_10620 [Proteobacteria bacterium]|nr:hypothetical protein [Pseudomonadota bacterium]
MKTFASLIVLGAVSALGACTGADDGTHRHGPRGALMQDAAMPDRPAECPYDSETHSMHRPHDSGRMLTTAHPGCTPEDRAGAEQQQQSSQQAPN